MSHHGASSASGRCSVTRRQAAAAIAVGLCAAPLMLGRPSGRAYGAVDPEAVLARALRFPNAMRSRVMLAPGAAIESGCVSQYLALVESVYADGRADVTVRCHVSGLMNVDAAELHVELTAYDIDGDASGGPASFSESPLEQRDIDIDVASGKTDFDIASSFSLTGVHFAFAVSVVLSVTAAGDSSPCRYALSCFDSEHHPVRVKNGVAYPVNDNGYTFGTPYPIGGVLVSDTPGQAGVDESTDPDLILAQNDEGVKGYVYAAELDGRLPASPAEALAMMQEQEAAREVSMYLPDGETVVGVFKIGL